MLLNIDPKTYCDKVVIQREMRFIYAVLKRAFYRALILYLLFWRDLVRNMKYQGFQPDQYYPCVMNKVVDGNYCTVCCHVDDLKISYMESTVANNILRLLEEQYGKVAPLTTTWGRIHNYMGVSNNSQAYSDNPINCSYRWLVLYFGGRFCPIFG